MLTHHRAHTSDIGYRKRHKPAHAHLDRSGDCLKGPQALTTREACTGIAHCYLGGVYTDTAATAANEPRAVALTCSIIWPSNLAAKSHQVSLTISLSPASDIPTPSHSQRSLTTHGSMRRCEQVGTGQVETYRTRRRQRAVTAPVCPGSTLATELVRRRHTARHRHSAMAAMTPVTITRNAIRYQQLYGHELKNGRKSRAESRGRPRWHRFRHNWGVGSGF